MATRRFFSSTGLRFSIRQLLVGTALVAVACVALRSASPLWVAALLGFVLLALAAAVPLAGQTDYYNTGRGRPLRVEDAFPAERYAAELVFAPLRLEHDDTGPLALILEPALAYGILPRTELEIDAAIGFLDDGAGGHSRGLAGVELGVLHTIASETRAHPAFALTGDVILPLGNLAPEGTFATVTGIVTRTFGWGRAHANAGYTFGPDDAAALHSSRWWTGLALDHAWPLRSLLAAVELTAEEPIAGGSLLWHAGTGVRWQWSPRIVAHGGVSRRFGDGGSWSLSLGLAYTFGVRGFIPVPR